MGAAADVIVQLGEDPPFAKILVAVVEAANKVRAEYETWRVGEDPRKAREQMVGAYLMETTPAKQFERLWRNHLSAQRAQSWKIHAMQHLRLSEQQRRRLPTRTTICSTRCRAGVVPTCLLLTGSPCAWALDPELDVSQYAHTSWKVREGFSKGIIYYAVA